MWEVASSGDSSLFLLGKAFTKGLSLQLKQKLLILKVHYSFRSRGWHFPQCHESPCWVSFHEIFHLILPDASASQGPAWLSRSLWLQAQCPPWGLGALWVRMRKHLCRFGHILLFLCMKHSHAHKIFFFFFPPLWFCGADVFTASFLTSFSQLLKKELDQDYAWAVGEKCAGGWQVQAVLPAASQTLPRVAVGKALGKCWIYQKMEENWHHILVQRGPGKPW